MKTYYESKFTNKLWSRGKGVIYAAKCYIMGNIGSWNVRLFKFAHNLRYLERKVFENINELLYNFKSRTH